VSLHEPGNLPSFSEPISSSIPYSIGEAPALEGCAMTTHYYGLLHSLWAKYFLVPLLLKARYGWFLFLFHRKLSKTVSAERVI
jgi:hypothetical protein